METILALGLSVIGPALVFAYGAVVLNRASYIHLVDSTQLGENNDDITKEHFLGLLRDAKSDIIIYDDGNQMVSSIYASEEVLAAFREKLEESPGFKVKCLFNCDDPDLPFRREFSQNPAVEIRTRNSRKADFPIHYKIIDGGEKAYLSVHGFEESEREFRLVDCTTVPEKHRGRVKKAVLRDYRQDFNRAFNEAAS